MKTWTAGILAVVFLAGSAMSATAQEPVGEAVAGAMTQAQLAQRLVERLGLWRFLGPNPSDRECMGALTGMGITPSEEGWKPDEPVTVEVLVRVLVLSLGGGRMVAAEERDDPQAWLRALGQLLEDMGILETIDGALLVLEPSQGIDVMEGWFETTTTDELRRTILDVSEVLKVFAAIAPPPVVRPRAVTPDMPAGL